MDGCRLSPLNFDVAGSAGWYSAVAGLLAGFAFIAVLLPLDHQSPEEDDPSVGQAVVAFVCAFVAMLLLSIAYASLSGRVGEGPVAGVAAYAKLLYGTAFGLSTLLILLGLQSVLRSYGTRRQVFEPARIVILQVTAILGPIVLLALQFANAFDVARYRSTLATRPVQCGLWGLPTEVVVNMTIVGVAVLVTIALGVFERRLPRNPNGEALMARGVLVLTALLVIVGTMVLPLLPVTVVTGVAFEYLTLGVTVTLTVAFAAGSWISR